MQDVRVVAPLVETEKQSNLGSMKKRMEDGNHHGGNHYHAGQAGDMDLAQKKRTSIYQ